MSRGKDKQKEYEWTIMLYLSGDNNLSEEMIRALIDVSAPEGVPKKVALTIQYDPWSPGFPTALYAIPRKEEFKAGEEPQLSQLLPIPQFFVSSRRNEDSSDPRVLAEFIRWSAKEYPSTYRMLILSGHGSGAMGDFLSDDNAREGQPDSLTIRLLAKALNLARHGDAKEKGELREPLPLELLRSGDEPKPPLLHILGMDSCLMGMAEVCHQIRDSGEYLVGSEGFVPNAGWPYAHLLKRIATREDRTPERMVSWIVEDVLAYYSQYVAGGVSFDMAACQLDTLPKLAEELKKLTNVLLGGTVDPGIADPRVRDLVIVAHWRAQSYKFEQHTDLWDFCHQLKGSAARYGFGHLEESCKEVKRCIEAAVVCNGHTGSEFQHSHGLSVYFPWSASPYEAETLNHYAKMDFPKDSGWSGFLQAYLAGTQRQPRKVEESIPVPRFTRQWPLQAYGPGRAAQGANRAAQGANRAAQGANRLIMGLYAGLGMTLPGSMKNPPGGVQMIPGEPVIRARVNATPKDPDVAPPKDVQAPKDVGTSPAP